MGGPQHGSGRPRSDPGWNRSEQLRIMVRPGEYEDLATLAKGWGVPVATAAWAILSDFLAGCRRQAPQLGDVGVAIVRAASAELAPRITRPQGWPSRPSASRGPESAGGGE